MQTIIIPTPKSEEEFDEFDRKSPVFIQAIRTLFSKHVRANDEVNAFSNGSCPVFAVGENYVAKFFPDIFKEHYSTELNALSFLQGHGFKSPEVIDEKSFEGWSVILMSKMKGELLKDIWGELTFSEKEKYVEDTGHLTKLLHGFTVDKNKGWQNFIDTQKKNCVERQKKTGLGQELLEQIPGFLSSVDFVETKHSFLHTEIMSAHVLVDKESKELSGFIDFEPSMIGDPEYDFASAGLFVAGGDSKLLSSFSKGYELKKDNEFHCRVMAYALLHRYSRLSWFMEFMPKANSLDEMAERWFRY